SAWEFGFPAKRCDMSVEVQEPLFEDAELPRDPLLAGLLAEFEDVDGVLNAAQHVRDAGYTRWDVHTPFPVHGMDQAMGIKPTILPWMVLIAGVSGMSLGILLQWYANDLEYPYLISGKPFMSFPAFVPVIFELTILCSALMAVF